MFCMCCNLLEWGGGGGGGGGSDSSRPSLISRVLWLASASDLTEPVRLRIAVKGVGKFFFLPVF